MLNSMEYYIFQASNFFKSQRPTAVKRLRNDLVASKKSSSDNDCIIENEKEEASGKEVQVVVLESDAESDDDSIVEEEKGKPDGQNAPIVVLESSSEEDSSSDEEEAAQTEGAAGGAGAAEAAKGAAEPAKGVAEPTPIAVSIEEEGNSTNNSYTSVEELSTEEKDQRVAEGCKLFVRGVTQVHSLAVTFSPIYIFQDLDNEGLKAAFGAHGKVLEAFNTRKGFAFVTFSKASEATAAIEAFDKQGLIKVCLARPKSGEVTSRSSSHVGGQGGGGGHGHEVEGSKLHVNNLCPATSRDAIFDAFSKHGTVVDIFYKPGARFAFVTFGSAAEAIQVIGLMNGQTVGGKTIQCSVARASENRCSGGGRGQGQGGRFLKALPCPANRGFV